MSYSVEWEPDARQSLLRLDPSVVSEIRDGVDRLAIVPTRLSSAHGKPSYGHDQRYAFQIDRFFIAVFFKYSQDETTLYISDVSILKR